MQIIFRIDFTLCVLLVSVWMLFKLEVYREFDALGLCNIIRYT